MRPHRHESMYSYLITKKVSSETLKTTIFESSSTQNFFFFIILDSIFHLSRHMLNFYHIRNVFPLYRLFLEWHAKYFLLSWTEIGSITLFRQVVLDNTCA